jgi:predicted short-subunit dehydrogenase-like oxidoreductase (DUF2520 family)
LGAKVPEEESISSMDTVIIGSGNVATVLGKKLFAAGHRVRQVFSRNETHAAALAAQLESAHTSRRDQIDPNAGFYVIALSDNAIPGFIQGLEFQNALVVHTAGAVAAEVLKSVSGNYGVFYPLQSLRANLPQPSQLCMLVDASTPEGLKTISSLAGSMGAFHSIAGDTERLKYHLAAVIVNNFTNHLFTLAADFCKKEGLDFQLLLPLMEETVSRLATSAPAKVQTGPAIRRDDDTIQKHLSLLEPYPALRHFYQIFTDSIQYFPF